MKINISEILIAGAELKARKLDADDPNLKRAIEQTLKAQDECLRLKKIDWKKMSETYINV